MMWVWITLGIFLVAYAIYYYLNRLLLPKYSERIGNEEMQIATVKQLISSEQLKDTWSSTSGSTLIFYIYPILTDRTAVSGNEYATIIQIGTKQTFKLLIAPDAGRDINMAPALFEVYVKGLDDPEIIEIPNIPLQRWTSIAIVKLGRKFNIYINGKLTISHMCTAMPDFDETQPLRIGDPRLGGQFAQMSLMGYAMQTNEIRAFIANKQDTEGKPYLSSGIFSFIPTFYSWCPGGNCNLPKKAGALEEWVSPYA